MGDLSHAMRNLVDDIRTSTESRRVKISEMKSDTHNMMERFQLERQDLANTLARKFASDRAAREEATQQFISDVKAFRGGVRSDIQDAANALKEKLASGKTALREATQHFISDVRFELQDMGKALEEKLSSDRVTLRDATQQFMGDVRSEHQDMANAVKEKLSSDGAALREGTQQFMDELASDRGGAREIWRRGFAGMSEKAAPQPVAKEEEEAVEEVGPSPEDQILEVIAGHPEGIRLVDIGNELGVDWRGLIGAIKLLVDEGRVEKIDNLYYPKS